MAVALDMHQARAATPAPDPAARHAGQGGQVLGTHEVIAARFAQAAQRAELTSDLHTPLQAFDDTPV